MPRAARKKSESGFYHVVVKGDGGKVIFLHDKNRLTFLRELEDAASDFQIEVHAYCLMDNHVHLLVRDAGDKLGACMKRLCERYAGYFSRLTGHVGHVFQGRYWSEPVDTDEYYLCAIRYILSNPTAAGICAAHDYRWSNYQAFLGAASFTQTAMALEMLGGVAGFTNFVAESLQLLPFSESKLRGHFTSDELVRIAASALGEETLATLPSMSVLGRIPHLRKLCSMGFSEREIARITGLGRDLIHYELSKAL